MLGAEYHATWTVRASTCCRYHEIHEKWEVRTPKCCQYWWMAASSSKMLQIARKPDRAGNRKTMPHRKRKHNPQTIPDLFSQQIQLDSKNIHFWKVCSLPNTMTFQYTTINDLSNEVGAQMMANVACLWSCHFIFCLIVDVQHVTCTACTLSMFWACAVEQRQTTECQQNVLWPEHSLNLNGCVWPQHGLNWCGQ